jgi:hypothetical protein
MLLRIPAEWFSRFARLPACPLACLPAGTWAHGNRSGPARLDHVMSVGLCVTSFTWGLFSTGASLPSLPGAFFTWGVFIWGVFCLGRFYLGLLYLGRFSPEAFFTWGPPMTGQ